MILKDYYLSRLYIKLKCGIWKGNEENKGNENARNGDGNPGNQRRNEGNLGGNAGNVRNHGGNPGN